MTRNQYLRMTAAMRRITLRLPYGAAFLRLPTLVCAACYLAALAVLAFRRDIRLVRVLLVPAACFCAVTALRPVIHRPRPYDRFGAPPVGAYLPGKGKSMPSRHTASAAAIALAVVYAFPSWPLAVGMLALCVMIAAVRVLSGQHYISDVLAALALSLVISCVGYGL